MEITKEMTKEAYAASQKVYAGKMKKEDALDYLENECKMNRSSANDYIRHVKAMMDGEMYPRGNSIYGTKYLLEHIYTEHGKERLKNALSAVSQHLDYQEKIGKGRSPGIMKIHDEYLSKL